MNPYASFDEHATNYIKISQKSWLNVAEGG